MTYPMPVFSDAAPIDPSAAEPAAAPAASVEPPAAARIAKAPSPLVGKVLRGIGQTAATLIPPILTLGLILVVWEQVMRGQVNGVPAPSTIWTESRELILQPFYDRGGTDKGLFWQVLTSLQRVGVGFSLAAICGVLLGVLVGANRWAHRGLDPIFQVLRTVPPLAWLPISLAAFREAQPSALFVIFITSIWPVIINTAVGVRNTPQDYINVARVLRLSPLEYFWKILLPSATPYIFTGLRIGIGMSWLAIVASEMLLGGVGVGFFIWDQYNSSRISDIVVALAWVGLVGFALDRLVALLGYIVSRGTAKS